MSNTKQPAIMDPPVNWTGRLKFLGPGFILSASIVGSGELIATTVLGARGGFITFWVILVSCLVKVAIQLEFGKNAILTGNSPMKGFGSLVGPSLFKGHWAVWTAFTLTLIKILQLGGMLGGSAIALQLLFPEISLSAWTISIGILSSLLIANNWYSWVEKISLFLVVGFTVFTLMAVFSLNGTSIGFTWNDVASGLQFRLPSELIFVAIGAFGITGVAADEIIAYNYWCLEKGYASYTGVNDGSEAWKKRAKGWIQVMYLDALVAMVIYTSVTAAFYLLGASVLHGQKSIPDGNEVINTLANIYTATLGAGVRNIYLWGAFFVLFSSVFATLAYWSRLFTDIFHEFKWVDTSIPSNRKKIIFWSAWILPVLWSIAFLYLKLPTIMVLFGGIVGSVLLLVVVAAGIVFNKNNKPLMIASGKIEQLLFWISVLSISLIALYGIWKLV
jgi:Mn2+/Fe2+ NRAMP family transporter